MQKSRYPPDNAITFERWYLENWTAQDEVERCYLPIQWTALYCNNGYGHASIINTIQKFIDGLDKTKKYYTIIQYDDGILNDIDALDIKVLAMAGPRIDYALPLLCQPHKIQFPSVKKDIFASFIGTLTHPIRAQIVDQLKDKEGYYISTKKHELFDYCKILARSKYVLCPRGYGQSSFRICEAIEYDAIPVYISDEHIIPYGSAFLYGSLLTHEELQIDLYLRAIDEFHYKEIFYDELQKVKQKFTYLGCKQEILNYLKHDKNPVNPNILSPGDSI